MDKPRGRRGHYAPATMSDWLSPEQVATVVGISAHAVRERLRRNADDLISSGLASRADAGYDGGRPRWQISLRLVQQWVATPAEGEAELREQLELAQREVKVFEMEVEKGRAERTIESLRSQLEARDTEIAELRRRVEVLAGAVSALAEPSPAIREPRSAE